MNSPGDARPGPREPTLAVWKFASCDGCQLTLLNCEDELLQVAESVQVASLSRGVPRGDLGSL
jgi:sulfhydrogenase subunit delta